MPPRVTVIIPTYNWSSVLPYSIGSVLGQTFTDFELLVVGDGCTDDSSEVVAAIGDRRMRWISVPRSGHQSGPNNEGLRQAAGELIAYLGHDDLWLPHHLASAVRTIDAGADLAYSIIAGISPEGRVQTYVATKPTQWMPPTGVVHRKRLTQELGGWRDYRELHLDPELDLWRRAHAAGFIFRFVPRLTAVKFSAAFRRDVYRLRPCHEQAEWSRRIQSEPDLEVVLLAEAVAGFIRSQPAESPFQRVLRLLNPLWWLRRLKRKKGAVVRDRQQFKGVEKA